MQGYGPGPPLSAETALDGFLRALHVASEQVPADIGARAALYRSVLADKRILILVDNASSLSQVRPLLPASPTCMAIVTSRNRLSGLVVRDGVSRMTLDLLSPGESISLLRDTVGGERVDAEPDAAAELARRCAYLPLALRIIAERIANAPHVPLADFVAELAAADQQLDALSIDDDLTDVRAVFSWSYQGLPPAVARFFRLLGLHPGADISSAAAAALAGVAADAARRTLDALACAHLIQTPSRDRYAFHDLLHAYAAERAAAEEPPDEQRQARRRLYSWYLHMAEEGRKIILPYSHAIPLPAVASGVRVKPPTAVQEAMSWFERERLNILDIARHAERLEDYDIAWQLPVVCDGFFELKSYWLDWRDIHITGLRAARAAGHRRGEAASLRCLGDAYWRLSRRDEALDCYTQGVAASREVDEAWVEGFTLRGCGLIHEEQGEIETAADFYRQALQVFRRSAIVRGEGMSLLSLGNCYRAAGEFEQAISHYQQTITILERLDDEWSVAWALHPLGVALQQSGQLTKAAQCHRRALAIFRNFDDRRCEGTTLAALGDTLYAAGDFHQAAAHWRDALAILEPLGAPKVDELRSLLTQEPGHPAVEEGAGPSGGPDS